MALASMSLSTWSKETFCLHVFQAALREYRTNLLLDVSLLWEF
jgi:hypothetical protein